MCLIIRIVLPEAYLWDGKQRKWELSWVLQSAIREDLTPWEQVKEQGHPRVWMVMMWHSHGFREANSNYKRIIHLQYLPGRVGGSVSLCPNSGDEACSGIQGWAGLLPFTHSLWDRFLHALAHGLLQSWSNTLLQRRPLWPCTAGRSSWGEGRTKEKTGAGHQTASKERTMFGRVLKCTYFLGLTVHLILSMWVVSQSWI